MGHGTSQPDKKYFATTVPGLEACLAGEIQRIGGKNIRLGSAGVGFTGDKSVMMKACLRLRTAHRVLWNLARFKAGTVEEYYEGIKRAARWQHLVDPNRTLAIACTVRNAAVGDQRFAMLKAKDAIVDAVRDAVGARPSIDSHSPDVRVAVRWVGYDVTVSLDASGRQSLSARGYRTEAGEAPLRETLASGLLTMAGYTGRRPLVDPFCGSGTIPLEAAMIARRIDAGSLRREFGFERWPGHRPAKLAAARAQSASAIRPPSDPSAPIFGFDKDPGVLNTADGNVERGAVEDWVRIGQSDARKLVRPGGLDGPGLIVSNPPYGHRLGDNNKLCPMFRSFGQQLRRQFQGWDVWLLMAEPEHAEAIGLPIIDKFPMMNGPIDIRAVHFRVGG